MKLPEPQTLLIAALALGAGYFLGLKSRVGQAPAPEVP